MIFGFGKYAFGELKDIVESDIDYCHWIMSTDILDKHPLIRNELERLLLDYPKPTNATVYISKKNNWKGGRKKLPEELLRKQYKVHLNKAEHEAIKQMQKQLGHKKFGECMRYILLKRAGTVSIGDPIKVLENLDKIGAELNRVGNNINQVAKYANQFSMISKYDKQIIEEFNQNLSEYRKLKMEIIKAYHKLVTKF